MNKIRMYEVQRHSSKLDQRAEISPGATEGGQIPRSQPAKVLMQKIGVGLGIFLEVRCRISVLNVWDPFAV